MLRQFGKHSYLKLRDFLSFIARLKNKHSVCFIKDFGCQIFKGTEHFWIFYQYNVQTETESNIIFI